MGQATLDPYKHCTRAYDKRLQKPRWLPRRCMNVSTAIWNSAFRLVSCGDESRSADSLALETMGQAVVATRRLDYEKAMSQAQYSGG